jgi:hypothetical protein
MTTVIENNIAQQQQWMFQSLLSLREGYVSGRGNVDASSNNNISKQRNAHH